GPLILHDYEHAKAELRHDLGGLWTHGRCVEPPLRMRDWTRPDRGPRDPVVLTLPVEHLVRERLDNDLRGFHEARPRLFHRHAEPRVLYARGAAAEPEQAPATSQDVE